MEYSAYISLQNFDWEARKELNSFVDFLIFKYKIGQEKNKNKNYDKKQFTALRIDTRRFKFNRDEANER